MAVDPVVYGPVTVKTGVNSVGVTDGNVLIAIEESHPVVGVPTDTEGGLDADYVQRGSRAVVTITFSVFDRDIAADIRGVLKTIASPTVAEWGEPQTPGLLRFGDHPGVPSLTLVGLKRTITLAKTTLDPDSTVRLEAIGNAAARLTIVLIAHQDGSGDLYTDTTTT